MNIKMHLKIQKKLVNQFYDEVQGTMNLYQCCLKLPIMHHNYRKSCFISRIPAFLSYRRIGTDVEYEMSADTDGWVAVGFSSDNLGQLGKTTKKI